MPAEPTCAIAPLELPHTEVAPVLRTDFPLR